MKLQNISHLGTHQVNPAILNPYNATGHAGKTIRHQQTYGFNTEYIVIGEPYGPSGNGNSPYIECRDLDNNLLWYDIGTNGSLLGHSVAIYGDKIVVGVPNWPAQGVNNSGAVFVYDMDGTRLLEIYNPGAAADSAYNDFGMHVAGNSTGFATTSMRFVFLYDWSGNEIANNGFLGTSPETAYETGLASNNNFNITNSRRCRVLMNETVIAVTYDYPYQYPLNRNSYSFPHHNNNIADTTYYRTLQSRLFIYDMDLNLINDCSIADGTVTTGIGGQYLGLGLAITDDKIYATSRAKIPSMQIIVFDLAGNLLNRFKLIDQFYHSVQPTLSVNGKYICVGNTAGRPNNDLNPNLGGNFFAVQDRAELNLGQVDIYDTTGFYLGSFRDTYDLYNPTPTPQLGWVTQINDNNQLLIDGIISNPVMLNIIEEAVDTPKDVSLTATSTNTLFKLRDITAKKGTRGIIFESSANTPQTSNTYNVNIATLTTSIAAALVSARGCSVMADGARIFNLGGEETFGESIYNSGVRVYSPIFNVSAVSPPNYGGGNRAKAASADDGQYGIHLAGDIDGEFSWGQSYSNLPDELVYNMISFSSASRASTGIIGSGSGYRTYSDSNSMTTDGSRLYIQEQNNTVLCLRHIVHTYTSTLFSTYSQFSGARDKCGSTCDGSTLMFAGGGAGTSAVSTVDYFSITLVQNSTTIGNLAGTDNNTDGIIITDMSRAVGYYNNSYTSSGVTNSNNGYLEYTNISSKANSLSFGTHFGTTRRMKGSSIL